MLFARYLAPLFFLSLCPIACGGEGEDGADGNKSGTSQSTLEACEEACLEEDACDDTISHPSGYCANRCSAQSIALTDAGCGAKFRDLATCRASGNSCPLPDCLAETRERDTCLTKSDGGVCSLTCEQALACDNAAAECAQNCNDLLLDADQAGCDSEVRAFLLCFDPCAEDTFAICEEQNDAYDECMGL